MPERVAGKGGQQDFGWEPLERAHRLKPEPLVASGAVVGPPVTDIVPLRRPIAPLRDEAAAHALCSDALDIHHVHAGVREILETSGMVEIEVGEDDVPD